MPLPITHALAPVAAAIIIPDRRVQWRLVIAAALASALPDVDSFSHWIWGMPSPSAPLPPWWHRGAAHSLFVAVAVGCLAAAMHKHLRVRATTAGLVVGAAMASHGILDMLSNGGVPVAYLWPLSSARLFADWRPIHSSPIEPAHFIAQALTRLGEETWQLILPMFAIALLIRAMLMMKRNWAREGASGGAGSAAADGEL